MIDSLLGFVSALVGLPVSMMLVLLIEVRRAD